MTDKFANMSPEFARFLLVALDNGKTDSERGIAIRKFTEWMTNIGSNGYELVERIKTTPVSDEDMQKVFDTGREVGRTENAVTVVPKKPFAGSAGVVSRSSSVYGFGDDDRIKGSDVYRGYQWCDIAEHCDDNADRIPEKHRGFLADMADKLTSGYGTVSGKQAKYLANLFTQYLGGRI